MEKEHKKKNVVEEDSKEKNIKHENKHNELSDEGKLKIEENIVKCRIIRRKGKVMVICENPKHKQRQG